MTDIGYGQKFLTIIDGIAHDVYPMIEGLNSFKLGICKLQYDGTALHVHLRRPGLLIGKGGETINRVKELLGIEIIHHEVNLDRGTPPKFNVIVEKDEHQISYTIMRNGKGVRLHRQYGLEGINLFTTINGGSCWSGSCVDTEQLEMISQLLTYKDFLQGD